MSLLFSFVLISAAQKAGEGAYLDNKVSETLCDPPCGSGQICEFIGEEVGPPTCKDKASRSARKTGKGKGGKGKNGKGRRSGRESEPTACGADAPDMMVDCSVLVQLKEGISDSAFEKLENLALASDGMKPLLTLGWGTFAREDCCKAKKEIPSMEGVAAVEYMGSAEGFKMMEEFIDIAPPTGNVTDGGGGPVPPFPEPPEITGNGSGPPEIIDSAPAWCATWECDGEEWCADGTKPKECGEVPPPEITDDATEPPPPSEKANRKKQGKGKKGKGKKTGKRKKAKRAKAGKGKGGRASKSGKGRQKS